MISVIFPKHTHVAIEERYAAWQSELILRRSCRGTRLVEAEGRVEHSDGQLQFVFCNQCAHLDLGCGYGEQVDPPLG